MEQVATKQENYNSKEDSNAYSRNQNNMPEMKSVFDWSPRLYNAVTENSIRKDFLNWNWEGKGEWKENVKAKTMTVCFHILCITCMLRISAEEKEKTPNNTLFVYEKLRIFHNKLKTKPQI